MGVVAPRADLPLEVYAGLDSSGDYASPWLDSADVHAIAVACAFNGGAPSVFIQEGIYDSGNASPIVVRNVPIPTATPVSDVEAAAELQLFARYYRLVITGGLASNPFRATVRTS